MVAIVANILIRPVHADHHMVEEEPVGAGAKPCEHHATCKGRHGHETDTPWLCGAMKCSMVETV